ncbi:unnamed protein product [Tuber aestivum]|uniref:Uncharacterized protein n=1 Tax=Tuber aestivum TaxID=59557 RepID=A0A292Q2W9_9PEZI|nr:unnamed protein product [Tuber aestivum]
MFHFLHRQLAKSVFGTKLGVGLSSGPSRQLSRTRLLAGTTYQLQKPWLQHPGPCTSGNITRFFSASQVDVPATCTHNPASEAKRVEEFVDIHDIGGFNPKDFDVLISDIGVNQLKHKIADIAGISYHQPASEQEANAVVRVGNCFIYGRNLRVMFPAAVTGRFGKAFWIVFLVDTGSPKTYLSAEASDLFGISAVREDTPVHVRIGGRPHSAFRAPECSNFVDINILGTDFLDAHAVSLVCNPEGLEAKLFFDGKAWRVLVEGEKL